jgi:predicted AAA+ superfamily ATPase
MKRRYEALLIDHFKNDIQMAFVAGPRQVGKTTTCTSFRASQHYFNWDNENDASLFLEGPAAVAEKIGVSQNRTIVFDELHKYPHWRNFLKGFYDSYAKDRFNIVVTGSSRLDIYRKGADSLMGRYFLYHMHPLSVAELAHQKMTEKEISRPQSISISNFERLERFGGFPEPFSKNNVRFFNRWKRTRLKLLFREELRDVTRIHEVGQVELLAEFIRQHSGQLINYASLARKIRASQDSIRRWIEVLESLYYCFLIRPWTKNLTRSLLKEPKVYLTDWALADKPGVRFENMVGCHLLKAVTWWQDLGLGEYGLHFLRTKDKREIDFLVSREGRPWFMVEVKSSHTRPLNKSLEYFQTRIGAKHAFQVAADAEFEKDDCFEYDYPIKVPALTFLSQLI